MAQGHPALATRLRTPTARPTLIYDCEIETKTVLVLLRKVITIFPVFHLSYCRTTSLGAHRTAGRTPSTRTLQRRLSRPAHRPHLRLHRRGFSCLPTAWQQQDTISDCFDTIPDGFKLQETREATRKALHSLFACILLIPTLAEDFLRHAKKPTSLCFTCCYKPWLW